MLFDNKNPFRIDQKAFLNDQKDSLKWFLRHSAPIIITIFCASWETIAPVRFDSDFKLLVFHLLVEDLSFLRELLSLFPMYQTVVATICI